MMKSEHDSELYRRFKNDWNQDVSLNMIGATSSVTTKHSDCTMSITSSVNENSDAPTDCTIIEGKSTPRRAKRNYSPKEHYTRSKKHRMVCQVDSCDDAKAPRFMNESSTSTSRTHHNTIDTKSSSFPQVITIVQPNESVDRHVALDDEVTTTGFGGSSHEHETESGYESYTSYNPNRAFLHCYLPPSSDSSESF
jgi:hypothetical protein